MGSVLIRGSQSTCCASACRVTSHTFPPGAAALTSGASSRIRSYSAGGANGQARGRGKLRVIRLLLNRPDRLLTYTKVSMAITVVKRGGTQEVAKRR
ncbi:hypothetical protein GCM10017673_05660 [Streptosporangium violaceochromogenes]|nr:hypothetical protein GCM10017673_05660 [Streptosporangium violaceochromogenes]